MRKGVPLSQLIPCRSSRARVGLMGPRGSPSRCFGPNRPQNSWRMQGGSGRQHHVLMEIQLSKVGCGRGCRGLLGGAAHPCCPACTPFLGNLVRALVMR